MPCGPVSERWGKVLDPRAPGTQRPLRHKVIWQDLESLWVPVSSLQNGDNKVPCPAILREKLGKSKQTKPQSTLLKLVVVGCFRWSGAMLSGFWALSHITLVMTLQVSYRNRSGWEENKEGKGGQTCGDSRRLDFKWWAHNSLHRAHIIKWYTWYLYNVINQCHLGKPNKNVLKI